MATRTGKKSSAIQLEDQGQRRIEIKAPAFRTITCTIVGTAPYMQNRFGAKAMAMMRAKMEAGSLAGPKKKQRAARDFDEDFKQAHHFSEEGWVGIPAPSIRNACIAACRTVGLAMTHAKMSIFVLQDGIDSVDGTPLIRLDAGPAEKTEMAVRNQTGVTDIRVRPMWRKWKAKVRIRYDSEQFEDRDVVNLLMRAGMQVGIGEGRPFSKMSNGLGLGTFTIEDHAEDTNYEDGNKESAAQVGRGRAGSKVGRGGRGGGGTGQDSEVNGLAHSGIGG